ncbi:MAG: UDP-3-O-[3-hydroxymyristoyl] glucosamine N-acyltransferase [Candidatus Azotimanducaceae bacterium]|jgi:UDP-3-O-[3-hydroxymyristoyl] glucosamine N-acyltransferase|tara:strand:+ start:681 stop:1739 length:1059 start_codon:yes stop_codon:yes gene_type:complete
MKITLAEIANRLGADIVGPFGMSTESYDEKIVTGLGSLGTAQAGDLSHLSSASYRAQLGSTAASAVILSREYATECPTISLVVDQPYLAFAKASQLFETPAVIAAGIHPSAVIDPSTELADSVCIGPNVVIGAHCKIGANVQIHANTSIASHCSIGDDGLIMSNVSIYRKVLMGERCIIHSGVVLGSAGFGFTPNAQGQYETIAQIGGLRIGNDVSIGATTAIDCGAIEDTVIGDGVKIDNQVQIGHNCRIGDHTIICGGAGMAGSTTIGKHCVLAGGCGIAGSSPISLCDGVVVSVKTTISQSISKPGIYSGAIVASEHKQWLRNALRFNNLAQLFARVKKLENERADESD